jgi:hypothetical protein
MCNTCADKLRLLVGVEAPLPKMVISIFIMKANIAKKIDTPKGVPI